MMTRIFAIALLAAAVCRGAAPTPSERNLAAATPPVLLDFREAAVPDGISVVRGALSLSERHAVFGDKSLRWEFRRGGELVFRLPVPYFERREAWSVVKTASMACFAGWIYSEKPLPGASIRFSFGNSKRQKADAWFDYKLDFSGWRAVVVGYDRDMQGKAAFDMNQITVSAPSGVESGTLWLDAIVPVIALDLRVPNADVQQPFVKFGGEAFDSPLNANSIALPALHPVTAAERAGFRQLEEKLAGELGNGPRLPMAELEKEFREFGIRETDGVIRGRFLAIQPQLRIFQGTDYPADSVIDLRRFGVLAQRIGWKYRDASPDERKQLETIYLAMIRHMLDQGYADGSLRGSSGLLGYSSRELFASLLLMRDVLAEHQLLEPAANAAVWYTGLRFLRDPKRWPEPNADIFNTMSMPYLIALALMPDSPEKAAMLNCFQGYYGRNIAMLTTGSDGGFKPDGCVYHHWGHYPGYGFPALSGATLAYDMLARTPWALPDAARDNLVRSLRAAFLYTNVYPNRPGEPATAIGLAGRHPFGESSVSGLRQAYRRMADDPEMAKIYRYLAPDDKRFSPGPAAELPQGHWTFNYGCFGIHRNKEKMVTLKGFNRALWGAEIYAKDNRYGRYQSYGAISIIPQGEHRQEGWDWNRNPGTTTLHLPLELLEAPVPGTLMLKNDSRITGSSNLEQRFGMFGIELGEPEMKNFDPKFRAVKSVFAFGPRLVALGSGIRAGSGFPVETTLLQYPVGAGKNPVWFNRAKAFDGVPVQEEVRSPAWIADAFGNAWFVFSDGKLLLERKMQQSRHNKTRAATSGEFASVRIDHGVRPKGDRYEYLLDLDTAPEAAEKRMAEMLDASKRPYTVLRQDDKCHAVFDKASAVTAAIFFAPGALANAEIPITALTPGYVMYRREGNALILSLNTPDLTGFGKKGEAVDEPPHIVTIRIKGVWRAADAAEGATVRRTGSDTEISAKFRHGIPLEFRLER